MLLRLVATLGVAATCPAQVVFTQPGLRHFPLDDAQSTRTALGDFDGDGDLDAIGGVYHPTNGFRRFYRNDGHGVFRMDAAWPDVPINSGLLVADYDSDGDQDVLLEGIALRNQGGTFTTVATLASGVAIVCADFDGDGLRDLLTRPSHGLGVDRWRHVAGGTFTQVSTPTSLLKDVEAEARDFNGDGLIDLLLTAKPYVTTSTSWPGHDRLWLNNGSGGFTEQLLPAAANTDTLSLAVADFDGDLDQDAVLLEIPFFPPEWRLRLNDGTGNLPVVTGHLPPGVPTSPAKAADLDNDGDVDLVGRDFWLVNDGTAHFTLVSLPGRTKLGALQAVADVDGDNDRDLVLLGGSCNDGMNRLLLNDGTTNFVDATAFPWQQQFGAAAAGDLDGDGDVDLLGWQAGSVWRNEGTGVFEQLPFPWGSGQEDRPHLLDADLDGDLDVVFSFSTIASGRLFRLVRNTGNCTFVDAGPAGMPAIGSAFRTVATVDAEGDGDRDVLAIDTGGPRLVRNHGNGTFSISAGAFPSIPDALRAIASGDFDGDGDADVLTGEAVFPAGGLIRYFANNGAGVFTDVTAQRVQCPPAIVHDLAVGDVEGDGDLDVVVACWGTPGFPNSVNLLLRNNGGVLSNVAGALPAAMPSGTASLGDLDGDGDLDVVAGLYPAGVRWWQNQGGAGFADVGGVPTILAGALTLLADVDDDGDPDLLAGTRLLTNERWGLAAPLLVRIGRPFELELRSAAGAGAAWALPFFGLQQVRLPLPPFGTLALPPAGALLLPPLPLTAGNASLAAVMPADPGLVGLNLIVQALYLSAPQPHLSPPYRLVVRQ